MIPSLGVGNDSSCWSGGVAVGQVVLVLGHISH